MSSDCEFDSDIDRQMDQFFALRDSLPADWNSDLDEFDSDIDRQLNSYYSTNNPNASPSAQDLDSASAEFDSDLDRQMDAYFDAKYPVASSSVQGVKRKALKTRSEHNKRIRGVQSGMGLQPQLEFELVQQYAPEHLPRFHRIVYKAQYKLKHNLAQVDILEMGDSIDGLFQSFMQPFLDQADTDDQVSVTVRQARLREIFLSYKKKNFDIQEFANRLESINQSQTGDSFLLTGELDIEVAITKKIVGGRGKASNSRNKAPASVSEQSKSKLSIVTIENRDNACGYWAVALAKYHSQKPDRKEWDVVRKNRGRRLENLARELCAGAGVDYDLPMDRHIMKKIDDYLKPTCKLTVVDALNKKNRIFVGSEAPTELFIEYNDNHYNTITKILGYIGSAYFCIPCFKPYQRVGSHKCSNICDACFGKCDASNGSILCGECGRSFHGSNCFEVHKANNCCQQRKKCPACEVEYSGRFEHRCGEAYCDKCKTFSSGTHHCYISPKDIEKLEDEDSKPRFFLSFDIESFRDDTTGKQYANLLISMVVCDKCYDHSEKRKNAHNCDECGVGRKVFEGADCVKKFGNYIYKDLAKQAEKKKSRILAFAHNFGGFDGHFIMQDMFERDYKPEVVMTGSRILKMDVGNVRFIDTLSLFQQPLASLPKSFGFQDKVVKGHFPHKFNTPDNYEKTFDRIPELQYFAPEDCRTPEDREKLEKWHSEQINAWVFRDEIMKYCDADVRVLLIAFMSFRKLFKDITGLDPVSRNFTLASIGLEFFRAAFLSEHTLGITPIGGYSIRNNSMISSAWISWIEKSRGLQLAKEKHIGPYFADAFHDQSKTVYEFNGCRWHGCTKCYTDRLTLLKFKDKERSPDQLYDEYKKKKAYYARHGFHLIEIWECDLARERLLNNEMDLHIASEMTTLEQLKLVGGAKIRESFFGGRTDNVKFFHEAINGECIEYKDVTSEYPYVLKFKDYPMGHPEVITRDFDSSLKSYFGFVKCSVVPPRGLYIPVLPQRHAGKLLFPLCNECATIENHSSCEHSDTERAMTGTWTTTEIIEAIEKGYTIDKIFEVLHYKNTSSDMFSGYINSWLKIKQEASGWPTGIETNSQKNDYIQRYKVREGVELEEQNIEHNPGKRSIAKLMLNSFWGKLSQRPNLPQVKICKEYHEYWNLLEDEEIEITGEFAPNPDTMVVSYQLKDDESSDPGNTSIAIASFVTSYARLHLYKYMELVDKIGHDRLLYFDTDSIIFVRKPEDPVIETGDYLGDLTDELPAGARCVKFVSGGPKNYGYEYILANGTRKTVIKTKGIRHNCKTLAMFNLNVMEDIVRDFAEQSNPRTSKEIRLPQTVFRSSRTTHDVRTLSSDKRYRVVSNKKWILGNETRPFGF